MKVSIRLSVLAVLVSFVLFVSFLLIYSINNRFNDRLLSLVVDDIENVVEGCEQEINSSILRLQNENDLLSVDEDFINLIKSKPEHNIDKIHNINDILKFIKDMKNASSLNGYENAGYLFIDDAQPMASYLESEAISYSSYATCVVSSKAVENADWYKELLKSEQKMYFFEHSNMPNCIFVAQTIVNYLEPSGERLGVSMVSIDFESILRKHKSVENKKFVEIMIVNENGKVICKSDETIKDNVAEFAADYSNNRGSGAESLTSVQIDKTEYLACKYDFEFGMTLVAAVPADEGLITIEQISHEVFWIVAFILIIAMLIAIILSRIIVRPIERLALFMNKADEKEELSKTVKKSRVREINSLYKAFDAMTKRNKKLLEVAQHLGEQKKEAEFKMLQSQINPHYLYNALDSISWMALENGVRDIADAASALADNFRYNAKSSEMIITLQNEIEFIKNYVKLQEKCRKCDFTFKVDMPERFAGVKIQKFMIQPLVENSILHGLGRGNRKMTIKISVMLVNDELKIQIEDDGIGFDAEKLNRYLNGDTTVFATEKIGIINIQKRLQSKYEKKAGLYYMSNEQGGLTAVITLPFNKGEKSDEIF
ncbi:MAG: histidine kinase [Clostridia bacterium]|nr:histidine kinase [Clostridia bacterium]